MPVLYLTKPGSVLRYSQRQFVAEAPGLPPVATPEIRVDAVVAFGAIHLTQPALARLLSKRTPVFFLTRFGTPRGWLAPAFDARVDIRMAQYRLIQDDARCLAVAAAITAAKITNARRLLKRYLRNHADAPLPVHEAVAILSTSRKDALRAKTPAELRGIEGYAAKSYFSTIRWMVVDHLFTGRSKHPPTDPANALLSLGYTLLGGEIAGLLTAHGLDPYLGVYHELRRGLPSLAQDLLEEFRTPIVDRCMLALLNTQQLTASDFTAVGRKGMRLRPDALKTVLTAYEEALTHTFQLRNGSTVTFRQLLIRQVMAFRRTCVEATPYTPFLWERG